MRDLKKLIKEIEADGKVTEDEMRRLHQAIMWDGQVTDKEKKLFNKLLAKLKNGKLKWDGQDLNSK